MIIAEANCVGAPGERCFRAKRLGRERDSSSISFSLTVIFFFRDTRSTAHTRLLVCGFFPSFLFPDENVMSEVEIAEYGPSRVGIRCCVTKL